MLQQGKLSPINQVLKLSNMNSYGILFMDSLFRASDPTVDTAFANYIEPSNDNAFVMRDRENGLNMDLMTYSMYALANKDPKALLDYDTLVTHADRTFQTFFQYFVRNSLSLTEGGLVYQKIDDESYKGLGRPVDVNGTALPSQQEYSVPTGKRTIDAWVSNRIQVLHLNPVATYLTVGILIWLIGTAAIMACLQRKYTGSMIRDVSLIADVLVLVAGSNNLLELICETGVELKKADDIKTMLGWFRDRSGEIRWGVEGVGGRDAVEWVDAPKTGWHVKRSSTRRWLLWGRRP
jgi:hypothetical protein